MGRKKAAPDAVKKIRATVPKDLELSYRNPKSGEGNIVFPISTLTLDDVLDRMQFEGIASADRDRACAHIVADDLFRRYTKAIGWTKKGGGLPKGVEDDPKHWERFVPILKAGDSSVVFASDILRLFHEPEPDEDGNVMDPQYPTEAMFRIIAKGYAEAEGKALSWDLEAEDFNAPDA